MRDGVDEIQEAWRRERPDIDVTSIGLITRIWRLARHLERARKRALAELDLDEVTLDALAVLRRSGAPYRLTAGQMQQASLITTGAVTQRLDRLELVGLVRRQADQTDGRVVWVQLTSKGRATIDGVVAGLMERENALVAPLSVPQRENLTRLLRRWLVSFEEDQREGPLEGARVQRSPPLAGSE
jgi:DNA-binding MarR family transcriptional regulator